MKNSIKIGQKYIAIGAFLPLALSNNWATGCLGPELRIVVPSPAQNSKAMFRSDPTIWQQAHRISNTCHSCGRPREFLQPRIREANEICFSGNVLRDGIFLPSIINQRSYGSAGYGHQRTIVGCSEASSPTIFFNPLVFETTLELRTWQGDDHGENSSSESSFQISGCILRASCRKKRWQIPRLHGERNESGLNARRARDTTPMNLQSILVESGTAYEAGTDRSTPMINRV